MWALRAFSPRGVCPWMLLLAFTLAPRSGFNPSCPPRPVLLGSGTIQLLSIGDFPRSSPCCGYFSVLFAPPPRSDPMGIVLDICFLSQIVFPLHFPRGSTPLCPSQPPSQATLMERSFPMHFGPICCERDDFLKLPACGERPIPTFPCFMWSLHYSSDHLLGRVCFRSFWLFCVIQTHRK